ncbi:MAG: hypothetical protein F6K19_39455 [Cyanothece sp. SIO1E1]|nr:hypothetical protein [Cyanothece sp. SIO1E1]
MRRTRVGLLALKQYQYYVGFATLAIICNGGLIQAESLEPFNTSDIRAEIAADPDPLGADSITVAVPTSAETISETTESETAEFQILESETLQMTQLIDGEPDELQRRRSYIGIGGNIGASGSDSSLGEGGFAIVNKGGFLRNLSTHGALIIGGSDATGTTALTGELPIKNRAGEVVVIPFIGGGLWFHGEVDPLFSAGVDLPFSEDVSGTVRVNAGFDSDETDVGVMLGLGYNFSIRSILRKIF